MRLHADDSKLIERVKAIEHVNRIQVSLNNLVIWADLWDMFYNLIKICHNLHIGNKFTNTEHTMETSDGPIRVEKVDQEKDLGVILDRNMKFGKHISIKVTKANQILGLIFRTFTYMYMDREMFLNLYKSLSCPHVVYATSVRSPIFKKDIILIENIQRRATRLVSGLKHLSYPVRLKALGLPMLEYRVREPI